MQDPTYKHKFSKEVSEGVRLFSFDREVWRPAIASPMFVGWGLKKAKCGCGKVFKDLQSYLEHLVYFCFVSMMSKDDECVNVLQI